jgi:hypothetical protein
MKSYKEFIGKTFKTIPVHESSDIFRAGEDLVYQHKEAARTHRRYAEKYKEPRHLEAAKAHELAAKTYEHGVSVAKHAHKLSGELTDEGLGQAY